MLQSVIAESRGACYWRYCGCKHRWHRLYLNMYLQRLQPTMIAQCWETHHRSSSSITCVTLWWPQDRCGDVSPGKLGNIQEEELWHFSCHWLVMCHRTYTLISWKREVAFLVINGNVCKTKQNYLLRVTNSTKSKICNRTINEGLWIVQNYY